MFFGFFIFLCDYEDLGFFERVSREWSGVRGLGSFTRFLIVSSRLYC